jgi:fructose-1,6-bisphosphatase/inositol monophosphatase family enzyme
MMPLPHYQQQQNNQTLISFATNALQQAGIIARKYFRNHGFSATTFAESKADCSTVTIADREIELLLRHKINATFPTHKIIGEEFNTDNLEGLPAIFTEKINVLIENHDDHSVITVNGLNYDEFLVKNAQDDNYYWLIDPIDGTKSFCAGKPTFTILLGLYHHGEMLLGACHQPILNETWLSCQQGVLYINGINSTNNSHDSNDASSTIKYISRKTIKPNTYPQIIATTGPEYFSDTEYDQFKQLANKYDAISYGGDAYNYMMLAMGNISCIMETNLNCYDVMPLLDIINRMNG